MNIAMCLIADERVLRTHIKHALASCGVGHLAEDRQGLFGEFVHSQLYFSHNDIDPPQCPQWRSIDLPWQAAMHMVFHYPVHREAMAHADLCQFMQALSTCSEGLYVMLVDGICRGPRSAGRPIRPPDGHAGMH